MTQVLGYSFRCREADHNNFVINGCYVDINYSDFEGLLHEITEAVSVICGYSFVPEDVCNEPNRADSRTFMMTHSGFSKMMNYAAKVLAECKEAINDVYCDP